jgi:uncharacterized protein
MQILLLLGKIILLS